MSIIMRRAGGGGKFLRLYFILVTFISCMVAEAEEPPYKGIINHFDDLPNQFFTLDTGGNIAVGDTFYQATGLLTIDPTGNILLGNDIDFLTTKTLKWYRIEEESFVESPHKLPTPYPFPVVWTPTAYRAVAGILPIRVWQLNPVTLQTTMLSEYMDPEARGNFATFVPELGYLYYDDPGDYALGRVHYNDATGMVSGPVIIFPTPRRGNMDMVQTSDGRLIVQLSSASYVTIFHVQNDGSLTITYDGHFNTEFGITNIYKAAISPDDRFLFIIAIDGNNVNSFDLSSSGTITPITRLSGFTLAQALALTPDGRFLVVAHHYLAGYPAAILSVFEVGEDGSLTYLSGKDVPLSDTVAELAFFPPSTALSTAAKNWQLYW